MRFFGVKCSSHGLSVQCSRHRAAKIRLISFLSDCRNHFVRTDTNIFQGVLEVMKDNLSRCLCVGVIRVYGIAEFEENLSRNTEF